MPGASRRAYFLVALSGRQRPPVRPPVDHADEQSAAGDIAQGDGDEVVDGKVAPGQTGQRLGGQARSLGKKFVACGHDARRDVIHVGDTVLEAGGDEQPDGEEDAQHLAGLAAGAPAEPDRQTNQPVAHQAQVEGGQKVQGDLAGGDAQGHTAKHPGAAGELAGRDDHMGKEEAAQKIADVDEQPVAQHGCQGDAFFRKGHAHERIAGEELRPCQHDQHQAHGKDGACQTFAQTVGFRPGEQVEGGHVGTFRSKGDEGPGPEGEHDLTHPAGFGLFLSHGYPKGHGFRLTQHKRIHGSSRGLCSSVQGKKKIAR